jgi:hypothetical protein
MPDLWDVLTDEAAAESLLWSEALLPVAVQRREPIFSALCRPEFALGVETVYEGYLLHYGRSRLFAPEDEDAALLCGDYLYAHGLVRVSATGSTAAVHDLAELISLCSHAHANGTDGDWAVWAATCAVLGGDSLDTARSRLREEGDTSELERVARAAADAALLERALSAHRALVSTATDATAPTGPAPVR